MKIFFGIVDTFSGIPLLINVIETLLELFSSKVNAFTRRIVSHVSGPPG